MQFETRKPHPDDVLEEFLLDLIQLVLQFSKDGKRLIEKNYEVQMKETRLDQRLDDLEAMMRQNHLA